jgi:hypothetical protein
MSIAEITRDQFHELLRRGMVATVPVLAPLPEDLEELHQQLERKRQVILQGPPGVGKTFTARRYISWLARDKPEPARLTTLLGALPKDRLAPEADEADLGSEPKRTSWWSLRRIRVVEPNLGLHMGADGAPIRAQWSLLLGGEPKSGPVGPFGTPKRCSSSQPTADRCSKKRV